MCSFFNYSLFWLFVLKSWISLGRWGELIISWYDFPEDPRVYLATSPSSCYCIDRMVTTFLLAGLIEINHLLQVHLNYNDNHTIAYALLSLFLKYKCTNNNHLYNSIFQNRYYSKFISKNISYFYTC